MVGVAQEAGEHLHEAAEQLSRRFRQVSQSGTSGSWRDSFASAGTIPNSFCRAKVTSR